MSFGKSYARALVEAASERGLPAVEQDRVESDLLAFSRVFAEHALLRAACLSPVTSRQEKVELIEASAQRMGLHALALDFLRLLARKGRLGRLPEIVEAFAAVRLEATGGVRGRVESAEPLTPEDVAGLAKAFTKKLKRPVALRAGLDPDLLAGVKVELQGVTYDGSLRAQLRRVRDRLVGATG